MTSRAIIMKISTIAVHGGLTDTSHYAAAFPVYLTSTFIQKGPTEFREYGYSRTANPTRSDVEKHAADIEGAKHGIATATGMAAVSLVFETLNAGDRVLISNNVYGGTWLYATELFKKRGVEFTVVDDFNSYDFETAPADVKLVYIETPLIRSSKSPILLMWPKLPKPATGCSPSTIRSSRASISVRSTSEPTWSSIQPLNITVQLRRLSIDQYSYVRLSIDRLYSYVRLLDESLLV